MRMSLPLSRPEAGGPVVLWGGALPSGSLKYLTFSRFLADMPGDARGLVEMSGASTALALDALGRERGLPTVALTDASGETYLRARGFRGEVRTGGGLAEQWERCLALEREGWLWPRQLANGALIGCVEDWAKGLLARVRDGFPAVRTLVCGFGTGATAVGLHRVFAPAGFSVVALQPSPGESLPGWRTWATQNLGARDLFHPHRDEVPLDTARPAPDGFGALQNWARAHPQPDTVLVIAHGARP
ncbi:hypothetical protein DRW03_00310 [Corallococcus sp. H22C18031201]|uniref:pyridoxal-phosphate dependent enzyme n=1 Tax=Citreicoccus inhibens TaxID=2849499 RepID=UPI000E715DCB|nr:pyridoxal-phosphate dependent enzyme [Citreicoccus inhibens]MBU8899968.1 pyridoxal-phosphate dependent enzyme [Citreicoccus inhibens]RJS27911.1 hypothetical protein DRW03_00310 [Corallococcus sp. H22C18031201]